MKKHSTRVARGFTLIEILVVIGIIAILAAVVLIAINPARQFAQARNSQRVSNVNAILNAIGQRMADNKGLFKAGDCTKDIPTASSTIASGVTSGDIASCLVPIYLATLPVDPAAAAAHFASNTDYDTQYEVKKDSATSRITVCALGANEELETPACVTR